MFFYEKSLIVSSHLELLSADVLPSTYKNLKELYCSGSSQETCKVHK